MDKMAAVLKRAEFLRKTRKRNYQVFYALPASALPEFESALSRWLSRSPVHFTFHVDDVFMPHFSTEAPLRVPDILSLSDILSCFQLVMLEVKVVRNGIR